MARSGMGMTTRRRIFPAGMAAIVGLVAGCASYEGGRDYPAPFVWPKTVKRSYTPMRVGVGGEGAARVGRNDTQLNLGENRSRHQIGTSGRGVLVGRSQSASVTFGSAGRAGSASVNTASQRYVGLNDSHTTVGQAGGGRRAIAQP